jgi:hypothetical protein
MEIEGQTQQQGLAGLGMDGSAWGAAREFAFHCREDAFDEGAFSILLGWEAFSHLKPHTRCLAIGAALSGDDTVGPQLLATKWKYKLNHPVFIVFTLTREPA